MRAFIGIIIFLFSQGTLAKPTRVISLSPAMTELIYALHFENLLVGVSDFSDYPQETKSLPSVGPYTKPNFEKIIELKPDLVFVPLEGPEDVKHRLDQLHFRYAVISMRKLKEIGEAAESISRLLEAPKEGQSFKTGWNTKLAELFSHKIEKPRSIFVEIQKDPLIAAGSNTFLDEIVKGCGGTNVVKEKDYPRLSLEFIASRPIDLVLLADYFRNSEERDATIKWWVNKLHAPKNIIPLDSDITARPGPRLLKGIKIICDLLAVQK